MDAKEVKHANRRPVSVIQIKGVVSAEKKKGKLKDFYMSLLQ